MSDARSILGTKAGTVGIPDTAADQIALLDRLYQTAPVGLGFVDTNLRFVRVNQRLADLDGRPVADHIGRRLCEVMPGIAAHLEAACHKVLQAGRPMIDAEFSGTIEAGSFKPRFWRVRYHPVTGDDHRLIGVQVVVEDITESRRAQEALVERAARIPGFIANSHEAIWRIKFDAPIPTGLPVEEQIDLILDTGYYAEGNDVLDRLYGFTRGSDAIGHRLGAAVDKSKKENAELLRAFVRQGYRVHNMESVETDISGNEHVFLNSAIGFVEDGALQHVWGTAIDITTRKRAELALRDLSGKLITAQEDVGRRIARDLHDDFGQRLALLVIQLDQLRRNPPQSSADLNELLQDPVAQVGTIASDLQNLSRQLHPAILDHVGLAAALRSFCKEQSKAQNVRVRFSRRALPQSVPSDLALCLYRVGQEAVSNAIRHGDPTEVRVNLTGRRDGIRLRISDDGRGFEPEATVGRGGIGLASMRERLRMVGGELSIASKIGHGTRIEAAASLNPSAAGR